MPQSLSLGQSGPLVPSFLLQEAHHRMANSLAILAATLRQEMTGFREADIVRAVRKCEEQILAISELNRLLGTSWPRESTASYFRSLCEELSKAILSPLGIHCEVFVADGELDHKFRINVAAMLVELVTNSAKHAFGDGTRGRVRIEIESTGSQWFVRVIDNGRGFQRIERGTGSGILDSLAEALAARLTVQSNDQGTSVCIAFDI
jgi:two-component sensor histidine kinase